MSTATASKAKTGKPIVGKGRMLHTMIRVLDLDKSIDFYTRLMGMKLLRKTDNEGGRYSLAFVGYGAESEQAVIELTYNWDQAEPYALGAGFGHLAIGLSDLYGVCERLAQTAALRLKVDKGNRCGHANSKKECCLRSSGPAPRSQRAEPHILLPIASLHSSRK